MTAFLRPLIERPHLPGKSSKLVFLCVLHIAYQDLVVIPPYMNVQDSLRFHVKVNKILPLTTPPPHPLTFPIAA